MVESKLIKVMDYFAPFYKPSKDEFSIRVCFNNVEYILLDPNKFHQALNSKKINKKPYGLGIQTYNKKVWIQHMESLCLRFWITKENGGIKDNDKFFDLEFNEDISFKDVKFIAKFYWLNNYRYKELVQRPLFGESSINIGKYNG